MKKIPILIVDDRKENLLTLENLLDKPELELVRAESGNEALAKVFDYEFALILMDVQMPGMDGYETAELMRGSTRSKSIPIIFVTAARMDREHMFKGYDSGAVDYLFKPLEPQILRSKVDVFLELHRQRQQLEQKTRELDAKILELEVLQKELEEKNEKLEVLSSLDGLTGLFNRRYFDNNLLKEWKQALRAGSSLSLLLIDIDHFKNFNDFYGHIEGDDCLRKVAQGLYEALLRPIDIVARYGGEEFTAILPNTDLEGAEMVARRMMDNVAKLNIPHPASPVSERVTVSIGVTTMIPTNDQVAASLLDYADKALYEAKETGRNALRVRLVVR
ncbi:MAG: diguanylate cyclase [Desulfobulbaceae bacterium BRH_c16a]|nr:MAG: diguanylate cyclase [Desulfobulbaceae bacterium BRH_c16a]